MDSMVDHAFVVWIVAAVVMVYYTTIFGIESKACFWSVIVTTAVIVTAVIVRTLWFTVEYPIAIFCFIPIIAFCCFLILVLRSNNKP